LLISGDVLVRGAVALSLRFGVPALIVSLTIVAFGTSAPELLIAISAALDGVPELALGNVVGSNTANVLLVLGVPALLYGIEMKDCDSGSDYKFMVMISVVFVALCFAGPIFVWHGFVLLSLLALFLFRAFQAAGKSREASRELEEELGGGTTPGWKIAAFLLVGIIGLPGGAHILVDSATTIAKSYGISEAVIGLTLVAIGTSLPELATTVMAAYRRQAEVAIGNVIGSNVFNIVAILGLTSFFGPLPVPQAFLQIDLWVMFGATAVLAPFALRGFALTRAWGLGFVVVYCGYMGFLIL
jgi:cation:H+ antiporter